MDSPPPPTSCLLNSQSLSLSFLSLLSVFFSFFFFQEKRRLQEEQDKARRDVEDEKLRLQQLKVHTYSRYSNLTHSPTQIPTNAYPAFISLVYNPLRSAAC